MKFKVYGIEIFFLRLFIKILKNVVRELLQKTFIFIKINKLNVKYNIKLNEKGSNFHLKNIQENHYCFRGDSRYILGLLGDE